MGVETTAQRPRISRRQLFKYGVSAGAAATVSPLLPAMTGVAHAHGLPEVLAAPKPIPRRPDVVQRRRGAVRARLRGRGPMGTA